MKMSYPSGDKKNILGHRLSNRYLSSDAFTSSAGKTSGRSISRLGSIFKGHKSGRRYSGTGQKVSLFELKNIALKLIFILTCAIVAGYTLPFTRYALHSFFASKAEVYLPYEESEVANDELQAGEYYVAPSLLQTDRFSVNKDDVFNIRSGEYAYSSPTNDLIGIVESTGSSTSEIVLFSDVGFKNSFFFKNTSLGNGQMEDQDIDMKIDELSDATTSSTTIVATTDTSSVTIPNYTSIVFEGLGYGQMLAKVPPQVTIEVGTTVYARTQNGLEPVARVSYVETDNGSTFTNIYTQILTPPYALYKVRIPDSIN